MASPMGMSQPQIPGMGQAPGMAGLPGMPDVHAGGPSSPFNIDEMLKTNEPKMQPQAMALPPAVPASPIRRTLQPWGDSAGTPQPSYGGQADNGESQPGQGQPQPGMQQGQAPGMGDVGGGMAPMVMLRLLKSLGRI